MGRLVRAVPPGQGGGGFLASATSGPDSYMEKVGKYIPAEVVSMYVGAVGIIDGVAKTESQDLRLILYIVVFVAGLVLTPVYLKKMAQPGDGVGVHIAMSVVAFLLWAYTTGGMFAQLGIHKGWVGGVFLILFTGVSGAITPRT